MSSRIHTDCSSLEHRILISHFLEDLNMAEEFPDYEYDVNQDQEEDKANGQGAAGKTTKYAQARLNVIILGY